MFLKIEEAIDRFILAYEEAAEQHNGLSIAYDENWPSACYQQQGAQEDWVKWRPVRNPQQVDFSALEQALSLEINSQLKVFYSRYWSDNLDATNPRGNLQLLQAWNEDDLERLQQNLVGHVLMKRRLGQPETLFFAVTDEEDFIITLICETGQVALEQVGLEPQEILAESLAEFLSTLEPAIAD